MPNRINTLLVQEYTETYRDVSTLIAVGYEGMNVQTTNVLRSQLAENRIRLCFVKNRIVNQAFQALGRNSIAPICIGQTAFADGEDPVSIARFLVGFQKEHKELKIHGALVEDRILNGDAVLDLSKSPTKEELKGIISGQALSPGASVSGALLGPGALLASQIKKHMEALEGGAAA